LRLDETEEGTADFRSVKLHILEASLTDSRGRGITVHGSADVHIRVAIEGPETACYLLSRCTLGPARLDRGARLRGRFVVALSPGG